MLWGGFGGLFVVLADLVLTQRSSGRKPWGVRGVPGELSSYLVALVARVIIGGGLAWACSGLLPTPPVGPFYALALGVGAPLVAEKLAAIALALLPPTSTSERPSETEQQR